MGDCVPCRLEQISANSVYGFTGATIGTLPCLEISASTTSYGREMIEHTKKLVMATFNRANGYEEDCDVIYGDTDSVMVNFKVPTVEAAMKLGQVISRCCPVRLWLLAMRSLPRHFPLRSQARPSFSLETRYPQPMPTMSTRIPAPPSLPGPSFRAWSCARRA